MPSPILLTGPYNVTIVWDYYERTLCSEPDCSACSSTAFGACLACNSTSFLLNGECLSACPVAFYAVNSTCVACAAGTFSSTPGSTVCASWATCVAGTQFQAAAPTNSSDRVCTNHTICDSQLQYETTAPTNTSNRVCTALTICSSQTQYQSVAPTASADRTCANLTICDTQSQFESTAPTNTSNRVCSAFAICDTQTQYQSTAPTAFSNRVCSALTECNNQTQYQFTAPTASADRTCANLTICDTQNQFESTAPTSTSNRVCSDLAICDTQTQYQSTAPTASSNRACASLAFCDTQNQFESTAPTASSNRVCNTTSICNVQTQYQFAAPTNTSDRICLAVTACDSSRQYQTSGPTATSDRVCANLTICNNQTQYQSVAPTATSDRTCAVLTLCNSQTQYQSSAPTSSSNRVCSALTVCNSQTQYQVTPPTASADRVCTNLTVCSAQSQYQSTAPTATSDRACANLTLCTTIFEYERVAPTATSDRVCGENICATNTTFCSNVRSVCERVESNFTCVCIAGWQGTTCDELISAQQSTGDDGDNLGMIVGIAVGVGIPVCCLLWYVIIVLCRRRKRDDKKGDKGDETIISYRNPLHREINDDKRRSFLESINALPDGFDVDSDPKLGRKLSKRTKDDLDSFQPLTLNGEHGYEQLSERERPYYASINGSVSTENPAYESAGASGRKMTENPAYESAGLGGGSMQTENPAYESMPIRRTLQRQMTNQSEAGYTDLTPLPGGAGDEGVYLRVLAKNDSGYMRVVPTGVENIYMDPNTLDYYMQVRPQERDVYMDIGAEPIFGLAGAPDGGGASAPQKSLDELAAEFGYARVPAQPLFDNPRYDRLRRTIGNDSLRRLAHLNPTYASRQDMAAGRPAGGPEYAEPGSVLSPGLRGELGHYGGPADSRFSAPGYSAPAGPKRTEEPAYMETSFVGGGSGGGGEQYMDVAGLRRPADVGYMEAAAVRRESGNHYMSLGGDAEESVYMGVDETKPLAAPAAPAAERARPRLLRSVSQHDEAGAEGAVPLPPPQSSPTRPSLSRQMSAGSQISSL